MIKIKSHKSTRSFYSSKKDFCVTVDFVKSRIWSDTEKKTAYRIHSNERRPQISAAFVTEILISVAVLMGRLFEEFLITKIPLYKETLKQHCKLFFHQNRRYRRGGWDRSRVKIPLQNTGRGERWHSKDASVSGRKFFVQIEKIPLNKKEVCLRRIQ